MPSPEETDETLKFEDALQHLEALVESMERGDVPLDELVDKFEAGSKLLRFCQQKLDLAGERIEILKQTEAGAEPLTVAND